MRMALRCACMMLGGGASAAATAGPPSERPAVPQQQQQQESRATTYEPRLPISSEQSLLSLSQLDELMGELPVIDYKTGDAEARERGFSFGLKPGKGVKAIARLRF